MQTLELLAVIALFIVWGLLLVDLLRGLWDRSPMVFQVAVFGTAAFLGTGVILVLSGDLVPDEAEDIFRPILFGAVIVGTALLAARESRSRSQ